MLTPHSFFNWSQGRLAKQLNQKEFVMAFVISEEKCIGCGACVGVCPTEAISQSGEKYKIDPDTCVDCGACVGECPSEAISQA